MTDTTDPCWIASSLYWRGKVLTGRFAHWCEDWDGLPIDETTPEWPCACAETLSSPRRRHEWGPSRVGHGEAQCVHCLATNREARVLGPYCQ